MKPNIKCFAHFFFLFSILFCSNNGLGQTEDYFPDVQTATGAPGSFASATSFGPETVDLGNLNVHLSIPLRSKPGRKLSFNYILSYDSSFWEPLSYGGDFGTPIWTWARSYGQNSPGWNEGTAGSGTVSGNLTYATQAVEETASGTSCLGLQVSAFVYTDAQGTVHSFNTGSATNPTSYVETGCAPTTVGFPITASDGSGLSLDCPASSCNGTGEAPGPFQLTTSAGAVITVGTNAIPLVGFSTNYNACSGGGLEATYSDFVLNDANGNAITLNTLNNSPQITEGCTIGSSGFPIAGYYRDVAGNNHATSLDCDSQCLIGQPSSYSGSPASPGPFQLSIDGGSPVSIPNYLVSSGIAKSGIEDTNGNYISGVTDTMGMQAIGYSGSTGVGEAGGIVGYGFGAAAVAYESLMTTTNFGCSNINEYNSDWSEDTSYTNQYPETITLADGRSYSFTYEQVNATYNVVTGRIASITLPDGGKISYTYSGINCADGSVLNLTRTLNDNNGTTSVWQYSRQQINGVWNTTITDPVHNKTVISFAIGMPAVPAGFPPMTYYFENSQEIYNSSNQLLETKTTCYNGEPCSNPPTITLPIGSRDVMTYLPDATGIASGHREVYDSVGNLITYKTRDFGAPGQGQGPLLSAAATTYATVGAIENLPAMKVIYDGQGNMVSKTTMSYDEYPVSLVDTASSPLPGHNVGANSGNLTTLSRWTSATTHLDSHFHYDNTGNIVAAFDPNGHETDIIWAPCSNAFPVIMMTFPNPNSPPLTANSNWDCSTGSLTESEDYSNRAETVYSRDLFGRPITVSDNHGTNVAYTYPTASSNISTTTLSAGVAQVGASSTLYDGFGRPIVDQSADGSNGDTVVTYYDPLGHVSYKSLPFLNALGERWDNSIAGTSYVYDALGRMTLSSDANGGYASYSYNSNDTLVTIGPAPVGENLKKRQLEYDGSGNLTSVCEVTSGYGSTACGQSSAANGYLTRYLYQVGMLRGSTQNAQGGVFQNRSITYDLAGRKVTESNPETGYSTQTYDHDPSGACSDSLGNLVKSVDAMQNITCYTYDPLRRLSSAVAVSGPYTSVTPEKHFIYDVATMPDGTQTQGEGGLLAEGYTCVSPCSSHLTDIFHSVSFNGSHWGETEWESTPNSNGLIETSRQNFVNGHIAALQLRYNGAQTTVPDISFSLDSAGRPFGAAEVGGNGLVSSTTYYSAGSPASISYTDGNTDSFGYDPNSNRLNSFTYNMSGTAAFAMSGLLAWNANGSLYNFLLLDGEDSSKNQNCNFTEDDLERISSVACQNSWGQSFNYDPFGNVTKVGAGGSSYMAGYAPLNGGPMTNQVTSGPAASYDGNGNQTLSVANNLSWDAGGQAVNVNGIAGTYDAFGRLVETATSGQATQYIYLGNSKLAAFRNGVPVRAFIPLPGGATAIYEAGNVSFRHPDWLGSSRLVSDTSGQTVSTAAYAPFGEAYNQGGSDPDLAFTGKPSDPTTGIDNFLFRKYDTVAGRWLSPDPKGWGSVDSSYPQSLNRYAYVRNSPMRYVDQNGLDYNVCSDSGCYQYSDPQWQSFYQQYQQQNLGGWGDMQLGDTTFFSAVGALGAASVSATYFQGTGNYSGPQNVIPVPATDPPVSGTCHSELSKRIANGVIGSLNVAVAGSKVAGVGTADVLLLGAGAAGTAFTGGASDVAAGLAAGAVTTYGITSASGQAVSGFGQLYYAFTGKDAEAVGQAGDILGGPITGIGTLVAGGTVETAQKNAQEESFATAGDAMIGAKENKELIASIVDVALATIGMGKGCTP